MDNSEQSNSEEFASVSAISGDDHGSEPSDVAATATPEEARSTQPARANEKAGRGARPGAITHLEFVPFAGPREPPPLLEGVAGKRSFNLTGIGIAAALALLTITAGGVLYDRAQEARLLTAKAQENQAMASTLANLKERLDAMEAGRGREEIADLRKVLSEVKSGASATRDFGTTLAQLSSRVDHVEKDQSARLDKLGDRIDHDSATRLAEIATRLDKLEKKTLASAPAPAAVVAAAVAPTPPLPPKPPAVAVKPDPMVSNETTGSIEKPKIRLRGFSVEEMHDGYAVVDGREGPQAVAPGDIIPGAGRVLRIDRHGRDWVITTSLGVITSDGGLY